MACHLSAGAVTSGATVARQSELVSGLAKMSVSPTVSPAEESARRAAWERGQMDYMGSDSFENILSKMNQTLQK